jgi:murein DD-endopeptidase MepM/ murein hydrolase activator NlpD
MIKLIYVPFLICCHSMLSQSIHDKRNDIYCELQQSTSVSQLRSLIDSLAEDKAPYTDLFHKVPCINPLNPDNVKRISSKFSKGRFHPIDKKYKVHNGIDLSANIGKTVHAAADGIVINIQYSKKGYGKNITIQHAYGYITRYAHMALILVLKEGQKVKLGEPIGMVGSTGKSTGNHLHYEVRKEAVFLDPKPFINLSNKFKKGKAEAY